MAEESTLIYVTSNPKGDDLYHQLKFHHMRSLYVDAGYGSVPYPVRLAVRLLHPVGISTKRSPRLDSWLRNLIARRTLARLEKTLRPGRHNHIVYWHGLFPVTPEWSRVGRTGTITDVAMDRTYFEHFGVPTGEPRRMRERIWEINAANCDFIFTHSQWAAAANKALYPAHAEKVKRVGWGSDMAPLTPQEVFRQSRKNQVLCVGHDYYRKGVDIYDQVAGALHDRLPDLECLVAGRPGKRLDPGSLKNLTVLGPVGRGELDRLLRESKLFMLFSRFEPAGHVTIEAMSYGIPVVCSNRGGIGEPVVDGRTGFVCDIDDVGSIVEKSARLLSDPETLAEFSREAYRHATSCWQWKHTAARIHEYMSGAAAG